MKQANMFHFNMKQVKNILHSASVTDKKLYRNLLCHEILNINYSQVGIYKMFLNNVCSPIRK